LRAWFSVAIVAAAAFAVTVVVGLNDREAGYDRKVK
jgi:hypothetical protein